MKSVCRGGRAESKAQHDRRMDGYAKVERRRRERKDAPLMVDSDGNKDVDAKDEKHPFEAEQLVEQLECEAGEAEKGERCCRHCHDHSVLGSLGLSVQRKGCRLRGAPRYAWTSPMARCRGLEYQDDVEHVAPESSTHTSNSRALATL